MKKQLSILSIASTMSILLLSGCVTEHKAVGMSEATDGFAVRASANPASGGSVLMTPECIWLQSCFSYASSPFVLASDKTTCARVFTLGKKKSFLGSLFGVDDSAVTMTYIGNPNDTAADTVAIINAGNNAVALLNAKK